MVLVVVVGSVAGVVLVVVVGSVAGVVLVVVGSVEVFGVVVVAGVLVLPSVSPPSSPQAVSVVKRRAAPRTA